MTLSFPSSSTCSELAVTIAVTEKYPIYNHELLLAGTLKHEVDWDNEAYRVPKSV